MIDVTEAAKRLGLSVSTIRRMVREGHLPAYKLGKQLRFKTEDLTDYVEANRVKPEDEDEALSSAPASRAAIPPSQVTDGTL